MMSVKLTINAWNCKLPPGQKLVLLTLCNLANRQGRCWPTVEAISSYCGMAEATVRAHLRGLERFGFITRDLIGRFGMVYTITLPKDVK